MCGETRGERPFLFFFLMTSESWETFKEVVVMAFGIAFRILRIEWRGKVSVRHVYHYAWSHTPAFTVLVNIIIFKEDIQGM